MIASELKVLKEGAKAKVKVERKKDEIAAHKEGISYAEYQERLNRAMGYWRGYYCGS